MYAFACCSLVYALCCQITKKILWNLEVERRSDMSRTNRIDWTDHLIYIHKFSAPVNEKTLCASQRAEECTAENLSFELWLEMDATFRKPWTDAKTNKQITENILHGRRERLRETFGKVGAETSSGSKICAFGWSQQLEQMVDRWDVAGPATTGFPPDSSRKWRCHNACFFDNGSFHYSFVVPETMSFVMSNAWFQVHCSL